MDVLQLNNCQRLISLTVIIVGPTEFYSLKKSNIIFFALNRLTQLSSTYEHIWALKY